jgi:hypothetical protein
MREPFGSGSECGDHPAMGKRREGAPPAGHRRAGVPPPADGEVSARMLAKLLKVGKEDQAVHIKFSLSVPKSRTSESIGHGRSHPNIRLLFPIMRARPSVQPPANGSTNGPKVDERRTYAVGINAYGWTSLMGRRRQRRVPLNAYVYVLLLFWLGRAASEP